MTPWLVDRVADDRSRSEPPQGLGMSGDGLSSLDYMLEPGLDSDLAGVADTLAITNLSDQAVTVVSLEYVIAADRYLVRFATPADCAGERFTLTGGESAAVQVFVDIPGDALQAAAIDGMSGLLVATTATGTQLPVMHISDELPEAVSEDASRLYRTCSESWPYG